MVFSRRDFMGAGALLAAASASAVPQTKFSGISREAARAIEGALRESLIAGASPGAALALTSHGKALWNCHFGKANLETGSVVTPASVFRIGSLSKQFTAAMILKLAAAGKLDLDEPVSTYIPAFVGKQRFSVRELAWQTAGLHSDEDTAPFCASLGNPKSQIQLADEIAAQSMLFDFNPGTAWMYSNANYIVLGAIVEKVLGAPLQQAARALLFDPVGLVDTAFDSNGEVAPGRVNGYTAIDGKRGQFINAAHMEIAEAGGAGAMRSSATDLVRWISALFGGRVLDPRSLELMLAGGKLRDGRSSGVARFSPNDAGYGDTQYAMGWLTTPATPARPRSVMHYGAISGFSSCMEYFPDSGLGAVMMTNGDIGPNAPFRAARRAIVDHVLAVLPI